MLVRVRALLKNRYLVAQLKRQNNQIEQQSRNQLSFLASISHDVRTPLNGVLGIMELMRSTDLDEKNLQWLRIAMQSGEHLVSIIDDVLDLSRAEVGEFSIESQPMMPEHIAQNVIANLKPQADSKRIGVTLNVSDKCPKAVEGDGTRFYQILMNLAGNAVKFTDRGSVEVSLDYIPAEESSSQGMLMGSVVDTGVGIPQAQCETIFQKFRQVDAVARSKGGSGLGLAIVRTIVESWGGQVGVESEMSEGTRFWFSIPVGTLEDQNEIPVDEHESVTFDAESMMVLLVEDNHINQLVAGSMLDQFSLKYDIAEHGQQAIDMLNNDHYDVILMDCQMPVMDGYEASANIRHSGKPYEDIYIIALTASAMIDEERKCYRVGMNDFVAKPVQFDGLIRALNKAYEAISN